MIEDQTRLLTVLFADLSGSVAATLDLDPEEAVEKVNQALEVMAAAVARHGGRIDRYLGDGVLAFFGVPQAHEDDPLRAIRAALDITAGAAERGFQATAGIDTGRVYVGQVGGAGHHERTAMGPVLNLASRFQSSAAPGEVVVGEATWRLARGAFEFEPRTLTIKGVPRPVPAYVALRPLARPRAARGLEGRRTALVGRADELARLVRALDRARAGEGGIATIVGEAGVGKSRLVEELRMRAAEPAPGGTEDLLWLEGRCLESTTSTSYAPFVDLLRETLAGGREESPVDRGAAVADAVQALAEAGDMQAERAEEVTLLLGNLLSVADPAAEAALASAAPREIRARTFAAVRDYLTALSARRPLVVALEDLHWADSLSLELIDFLIEPVTEGSALLVCDQRPAQEHPSRDLPDLAARKAGARHVAIDLRPLDAEDVRRLLGALLGGGSLPENLLATILDKSEGNPLFLEEVLRSLIDSGRIERQNGGWQVTPGVAIDVPATVQSIVLTRIDRLDDEPRQVLQVASVIGRLFGTELLRAVAADADVERALWLLEQHDLVYLDRVLPEEQYSFEHVFTRDTVYDSLLKGRRAALHGDVARALEALWPGAGDERVEELAYHWERSDDPGRALEYSIRAGEKARRAFLNDAAVAAFSRALERLDVDGEPDPAARARRARVRESMADVLELVGRHDEAAQEYGRALDDRPPDEPVARARLLRKAGGVLRVQRRRDDSLRAYDRAEAELGEPPAEKSEAWWQERTAVELGRVMLDYFLSDTDELAQRLSGSRPLIEAHGTPLQRGRLFATLALLGFRRERYAPSDETVAVARRAWEAVNESDDLAERVDIQFCYGFALLWAGRYAEAEGRLTEVLTLAERIGDTTTRARCVAYLALLERRRGRVDAAREWAERAMAVAAEGGMLEYTAAAHAHLAWCDLRDGDLDAAEDHARESRALWEKLGGPYRLLAWIPAWPALGVAVARGRRADALDLARFLLDPERQPMPEGIAAELREGRLKAALERARATGYA